MNQFTQYWRKVNQWFYRTADRALDEAYKAALKIKAIEDEHFGGEKISIPSAAAGNQIAAYFQTDLTKYLNIARIRVAEFQTSRTLTKNDYPQPEDSQQFDRGFNSINPYSIDIDAEAQILEKLSFIDEILNRYKDRRIEQTESLADRRSTFGQRAIDSIVSPIDPQSLSLNRDLDKIIYPNDSTEAPPSDRTPLFNSRKRSNSASRPERSSNNKAIIDPSLTDTFRRIQQDLNPNAEAQVIENYRFHQNKTKTSLRFILILILVPLLVQYVSKIVAIGPAVDLYRNYYHEDVFLNVNLEKEGLEEMERFEKKLKFRQIVGIAPKLNSEQMEAQIKAKAEEIKVNFYRQSANAVKNWFADLLSIFTFAWLISNSKPQIIVLKSFLGDLISGLSDTAKAFMIILLTDTFVGFHSPHGWEIILEGVAKHLGLPENHSFNALFIATFPVLIDTVFKYWIFRYLSGQSPSAVATFKTMNE
jgi:CemA family